MKKTDSGQIRVSIVPPETQKKGLVHSVLKALGLDEKSFEFVLPHAATSLSVERHLPCQLHVSCWVAPLQVPEITATWTWTDSLIELKGTDSVLEGSGKVKGQLAMSGVASGKVKAEYDLKVQAEARDTGTLDFTIIGDAKESGSITMFGKTRKIDNNWGPGKHNFALAAQDGATYTWSPPGDEIKIEYRLKMTEATA